MVKNEKNRNILTSEIPLRDFLVTKEWYNNSKKYFFSSSTNVRTICINANDFLDSRFPDKNITDEGIKKLMKFILEIIFESCYYGKFSNITIFYKKDIIGTKTKKMVYSQEFSIEINENFIIYPILKNSNKKEFIKNVFSKGWDNLKESDF